jgi:anti-anti-sigma factor
MRYDLERPPTTPSGPSGIRPDALSFMFDKHNRPARLSVAGEIDLATCDSLVDAVNDAMSADLDALDIDLSGVTFCGSAGISAFLMARRRAQQDGKTLRLVNPSSWIKRLFTIAGVVEHLTTPLHVLGRQPPKRIDLTSRQPAGARVGSEGSR